MLGIEIIDAALLPALLIALLGGVLSFLSPCVLPIVPPYLAYMAGTTIDEVRAQKGTDWKVVSAAAFFVLGLSTVFIFLGFAASAVGRVLLQYQDYMAKAAGIVIVIFGLHFLGLFRIPLLDREARVDAGDQSGKIFGAYVLGLAFAFGWTPCLGPVLAAILSMVAQESSTGRGVALMAVYAFGLGIPFLLTAFFLGQSVGFMNRIKRHMGVIEKTMGALLIIVGVALFFGWFSDFAWWLLETFPFLASIG
jgi:cytochrome c-type biogenesis protein